MRQDDRAPENDRAVWPRRRPLRFGSSVLLSRDTAGPPCLESVVVPGWRRLPAHQLSPGPRHWAAGPGDDGAACVLFPTGAIPLCRVQR